MIDRVSKRGRCYGICLSSIACLSLCCACTTSVPRETAQTRAWLEDCATPAAWSTKNAVDRFMAPLPASIVGKRPSALSILDAALVDGKHTDACRVQPLSGPSGRVQNLPSIATAGDAHWWKRFDDPLLSRLIDVALQHHLPLTQLAQQLAVVHTFVAESQLKNLPDLEVRVSGAQQSLFRDDHSNHAHMSFHIDALIDIWGQHRDARRAHEASVDVTAYKLQARRLETIELVAQAYWTLASIERRRRAYMQTAALLAERVRIAQVRVAAGKVSGEELERVREQLNVRRQSALADAAKWQQARSALLLLLGTSISPERADAVLDAIGAQARLPHFSTLPTTTPGLPAAILSRRPDLQAHEQLFVQQGYLGAVQAKDLYPKLSLNGSVGSSRQLLDWLSNPLIKAAATLTAKVLDVVKEAPRRERQAWEQRVAQTQWVEAWRRALQEVDDALSRREALRRGEALVSVAHADAQRQFRRAHAAFKAGAADAAYWQDAQLQMSDTRQMLWQHRLESAFAEMALSKRLGGVGS